VQADDKLKAEVFTSWTSGGEGRAVDAIKKEFEKRGGVWESSTVAGFENANAAFQNRLVAGDPPTAKQVVVGKDPAEFIEQGLMNPIDEVAAAGKWKDVLPKALYDYISYDGKVYLTPTGIHGESWMFYSKDAFAKAGISEEPKDWDAFFADMDKLKAAGVTPIAWGGQAWQEVKVFNMVLLSQVGMDGFMKIYARQGQTALTADGVKKSLAIFGKLRGYVDEGAPGRNWNDATAMVITGKAGVQFMGDWAKGEFTAAGKVADKDFGCAISPASPGMLYISDAFGYLKTNDPNQDAAQKLLAEVVMDPAVQVDFSLEQGLDPCAHRCRQVQVRRLHAEGHGLHGRRQDRSGTRDHDHARTGGRADRLHRRILGQPVRRYRRVGRAIRRDLRVRSGSCRPRRTTGAGGLSLRSSKDPQMKRKRKTARRRRLIALVPTWAAVIIVYLGTMVWSVTLSFTNSRLFPSSNFVGSNSIPSCFKRRRNGWYRSRT
jgi:glucose/mannose transport system substrate-binding protein